MKKGLKVSLALIVAATVTAPIAVKVNAANSYIPELQVYQRNSSPKIEIGIDIAPEDVYYEYNFTNESKVNRNNSIYEYGHQTFTTEDYYSAGKAMKIYNNMDSRQGNRYCTPEQQYAENSSFTLSDKCYAPNQSWVSITYKAKGKDSNGRNYILPLTWGSNVNYGRRYTDLNGNIIKYKDTIDYTTNPDRIYVYSDAGKAVFKETDEHLLCTSKQRGKFNCRWYRWNQAGQYFYKYSGTSLANSDTTRNATFGSGEEVLCNENSDVQFPTRTLPDDNTWHTYSANACLNKFTNESDMYDYATSGLGMYFINSTNGVMYIDDVKFGKASKVQVKRDNTVDIYEGYASDVTDNNLLIKPNSPSISTLATYANGFNMSFNAPIKQEQHSYKARSCSSRGNWSNWSKDYNVTLKSTPARYHIKLYKNGQLVKNEDINSTSFNYSNVRRGDRMTGELYTIDTQGQWSSATPINYTVQQMPQDLKDDCKAFEGELDVANNTDENVIKQQLSHLRTNTNIPYSISSMSKDNASKYKDGRLVCNLTINGATNTVQKEIEKRPEYQTEQELKEDITDYIGQTAIHNDRRQLPNEVSYSKSKDIEGLKKDIISKCKTNPDLRDIEIEFSNSATEFKSGKLQGKIYLKD